MQSPVQIYTWLLGQINFFLLFSFSYTYLLSCILFLFALRYFVNYAPLLRAVCKFGYSLLYYYRRNFCYLIVLEQWYFSLI